MTQTLSRPFFVAMLEREVVRADETGQAFTVWLVDVDDLKKVNARFGFRAGDRVIAGVADAIRERLRAPRWRDVPSAVARYDGDAIAIMLRRADHESAHELANAIAADVGNAELVGPTDIKVSIAAIVYEFGETLDALLARLERTLYVCKQFGQGRIEVAPSGGWERAARTLSVVGDAG